MKTLYNHSLKHFNCNASAALDIFYLSLHNNELVAKN